MKKSVIPSPPAQKRTKNTGNRTAARAVQSEERMMVDSISMVSDSLKRLTLLVDDLVARVERHAVHIIMIEQTLDDVMLLTGTKDSVRRKPVRRPAVN